MTTEALVPAAAEPAIVTAGGGEIILPQVIVDGGAGGGGEVPGILRGGGSPTRGRGRRTGWPWGSFSGRARREASGCATSRHSTSPPTFGPTPDRSPR